MRRYVQLFFPSIIKELLNPDYKQSLMDSLHRGNLQKVSFVGNALRKL